jgi:hypothetical protein
VDPEKTPEPSSPVPGSTPRRAGRRLIRWAVNLWLVVHISAIIIAPASVGPSSELVRSLWSGFRPYLQFFYLNHGYHYFAPEPSQSTLLSFVAERDDGTSLSGRIPDRAIVPRLLYHRHFMLTEHMNGAPPELRERWYGSYARHLGHAYGASKVSLTRQTHYLPTMEMVRRGVRLDDPASYVEQPLGVFRCDGY